MNLDSLSDQLEKGWIGALVAGLVFAAVGMKDWALACHLTALICCAAELGLVAAEAVRKFRP